MSETETAEIETTEIETLSAAPAPDPAPEAPAPVRKDRRVLRAVLRWTAAVAVFGVAATGTAYGITRLDRTDVPGLATESDGRWDYPTLVKPPLPKDSPGPQNDANPAGSHYADLRRLVLPAPKSATADKKLNGKDGWLPTEDFVAQYSSKDDRRWLNQALVDHGLRHIAARGWTTPDGTRTRIYLLQFDTAVTAGDIRVTNLTGALEPMYAMRGADTYDRDDTLPAKVPGVSLNAYEEAKPYGAEQFRQAYLGAGDTIAVIVQSRKGKALTVPFQQTVVLQSELLG